MYTYVYTYMYIHIYIYMFMYTYIYVYTYVCIYIYVCTHIHRCSTETPLPFAGPGAARQAHRLQTSCPPGPLGATPFSLSITPNNQPLDPNPTPLSLSWRLSRCYPPCNPLGATPLRYTLRVLLTLSVLPPSRPSECYPPCDPP